MILQDYVIEGSCNILSANLSRQVTLQFKFDGHRHCGSENMLLVCHVTSSYRVAWLFGCKLLTVSYQLALFGGHCSNVSGDIRYLIYHLTSQDHLIESVILWVGALIIIFKLVFYFAWVGLNDYMRKLRHSKARLRLYSL